MKDQARAITVSTWDKTYHISSDSHYLLLYFITSPRTNILGITQILIPEIAFYTGLTQEIVTQSLDELANKNEIIIDTHTNELLVINAFPHTLRKGGKPVVDLIKSDVRKTKSEYLLESLFRNVYKHGYKEFFRNIAKQYLDLGKEKFIVSHTQKSTKPSTKITKCEWCGKTTSAIHKHHHPIPKRLGGQRTVNICPNCHCEFHKREYESTKQGG